MTGQFRLNAINAFITLSGTNRDKIAQIPAPVAPSGTRNTNKFIHQARHTCEETLGSYGPPHQARACMNGKTILYNLFFKLGQVEERSRDHRSFQGNTFKNSVHICLVVTESEKDDLLRPE